MDKLIGVWDWLKGKRTYIAAAAAVLSSFAAFLAGDITIVEFAQFLFGGTVAATIRAGIK